MRPQHAGGKEREFVGFAVADDGVTGIGAAVVADDQVVLFGEEIDDFAFSLVAPLQADDTGAGHATYLLTKANRVPCRNSWRQARAPVALSILGHKKRPRPQTGLGLRGRSARDISLETLMAYDVAVKGSPPVVRCPACAFCWNPSRQDGH